MGSPTKEYIYAGGQLVATLNSSGTPTYHQRDHLSVRVNTDTSGAKVGEQGHYPFGEEWYKGAAGTKTQFTSYERDSESGLDYAMFRFDSSRLGRFMTPDPLAGSISNPQSLNRYGYVINDPINLIDPLGLTHECGQYEWEHVVTTHTDNEGSTHEHDDGYRLTCTFRRVHEEERDKKKKSIDIECDPRVEGERVCQMRKALKQLVKNQLFRACTNDATERVMSDLEGITRNAFYRYTSPGGGLIIIGSGLINLALAPTPDAPADLPERAIIAASGALIAGAGIASNTLFARGRSARRVSQFEKELKECEKILQ